MEEASSSEPGILGVAGRRPPIFALRFPLEVTTGGSRAPLRDARLTTPLDVDATSSPECFRGKMPLLLYPNEACYRHRRVEWATPRQD